MMFLPPALFFMLLASSMADVGPPLLHRSNDTRPARFRWTMPFENRLLYFVVDPTGKYVFCFNGDNRYNVSIQYKNRVNVNVTNTVVTFFLNEVTQADAGNFTCRKGSEFAASRPDCGQYLYYLDENTVPVLPDFCEVVTREEGQTLTLVCVITVTALPVPTKGYSWTFAPSGFEVKNLTATGVNLTIGSLSRSDTGSYSCEFSEDSSYTGKTSGKSSMYLTVMGPPASPPTSLPTSATPPVGPQQESSSVDFKTGFIVVTTILVIVVVLLVIFILYIVINFSKVPAPEEDENNRDGDAAVVPAPPAIHLRGTLCNYQIDVVIQRVRPREYTEISVRYEARRQRIAMTEDVGGGGGQDGDNAHANRNDAAGGDDQRSDDVVEKLNDPARPDDHE